MTTDFRALCAELLIALENAISIIYYEDGTKHISTAKPIVNRARAALADEPAVPKGREPVAVTGQPSDEDLWNTADLVFQANSWPTDAIRYARAVLARWGNPAPQPPAEGEVAEVAAWLRAYRDEEFGPLSDDPDARWITRAAGLLEREGWALHRLHRLQQENARFREPERTILCDILANGTLLPDPDGKRYGVQPVDGEVAELVAKLGKLCSDLDYDDRGDDAGCCYRAADLLQRLSPPQPVPVAERLPGPEDCAPWPGEPNAGRWCWMASCVDNGWAWEQRTLGFLASFPQDFTHWLPAHALPLPGQEVEG